MKILAVGDIHGQFGALNALINKKEPDILIQLGDNAYFWPETNNVGKIKPGNCKVYLIPGNHSDWNQIEKEVGRRGRTPIEIEKNIFWCPIGSTLRINKRNFMFVGGAYSIDKAWRKPDISWWEQETLNQEDLEFCLSTPEKVDTICSHTAPFDFRIFERLRIYDKANDHTMFVLNQLLYEFKPTAWYGGHWHDFVQGNTFGCRWWFLNCWPNTKWWMNVEYARQQIGDVRSDIWNGDGPDGSSKIVPGEGEAANS